MRTYTSPTPISTRWRVGALDQGWTVVNGRDWLDALSAGLRRLGLTDAIERMACESLREGLVIANDITHRRRFTIQRLAAAVELGPIDVTSAELIPLDVGDFEDVETVIIRRR